MPFSVFIVFTDIHWLFIASDGPGEATEDAEGKTTSYLTPLSHLPEYILILCLTARVVPCHDFIQITDNV